jgi:hypothetical protein
MFRLAILSCFVTIGLVAPDSTSAQVVSNALARVLLIKTPTEQGSGFTLDIEGRQYLITAKHLVKDLKDKATILIRENQTWVSVDVSIFPCADPVDIAVLVPPRLLTSTLPLEPAAKRKVIITQEVYFLGFPFGSSAGEGIAVFGSHPVPIGKHGILSAITDGLLVVDALSNPGFSGGPIVFRDLNESGKNVFYVLGVTKGPYPDLVHVTAPEPVNPRDDLSNIERWRIQEDHGQKVILRDTPQVVPLNSGLLVGYSIDYAVDMIHKHPIGPEIAKPADQKQGNQ